ncbi:MAG: hypothetical protein K2P59_06065 [Acetatifactor sp.]|nr:hypothetical protein [Acetatifactor sp.]
MTVLRADLSGKRAVQKTIPRARRSASVSARRQGQSEMEALSISYSRPMRQNSGSEDAESVSLFLEVLGRFLHEACENIGRQRFLSPQEIQKICKDTAMILHLQKPNFRIPIIWYSFVGEALKRIPIALLAEKDPDHADDIPKISELLALEAYTRKYERTDPGGKSDAPLFGYHRGEPGQPDFVYRTEDNRVLKRYDPMQLPMDFSVEGMNRWLEGAYLKHSTGKGAGAVCILDVSTAGRKQLSAGISIFEDRLRQIPKPGTPFQKPDQLPEGLIQLCNTYVVSYGSNAQSDEVNRFQRIFDNARDFLAGNGGLQLLEEWRAKSVELIAEDDGGGYGDLFSVPFPVFDSPTTE